MTELLDLLFPYPVLENLVSSLPLGDLFNLSKTNSAYRAALHGFERPVSQIHDPDCHGKVRPHLLIGEHRTPFWENLKARSRLQCSEPQHKRGSNAQGCHLCSMPVCEACIIKVSFAKRNDNTFQKRHRPLCSDCWDSGNYHRLHPVGKWSGQIPRSYLDQAARGEICLCTAKDGILCFACRTDQNAKLEDDVERCYGLGCPNGDPRSKAIDAKGRVCLWCSRQLPGSRSRAESRRDYDARHLFARSHSSYDRPPEEQDFDTFEEQRMLEDDALSRRKPEHPDAVTAEASGHVDGPAEDSKRSRGVEETAPPREEKRWPRSEATHHDEGPPSFSPSRHEANPPRFEDLEDDETMGHGGPDVALIPANHAAKSSDD